MGLGKTLQALAMLLHRSAGGAALVVAPTSVGFNWVAEAERFAPSLRVILYRGADRETMLANIGPGTLVVTSYDLMARDVDALRELRFHTLVLDEAQAIKNPGTARARAARQLEVGYCVALTGTPLENRTTELWSLMRRVAPGLLGTEAAFRERFARPIEEANDATARASLARIITPFLLRRTKAQVATDLPPRTEQVVRVELSPKERRLYDAARRLALEGASRPGGADRMNLLASLTRLRQLACHPRLVDTDSAVPSSKLEAAMELLNEVVAEGHKALVFSQFTRHLDLAEEAMREAGLSILRLQGDTPAEERQRRVQAFQAGEADVFLISLKAGGTGLNLTRATYVLHLDPWWNPAVEDQATDRAHRIGQQQPVTVYRFVTENTVEEAILKLHGEKRGLAADLLSGAAGGGAIRTDELIALLSGELSVRS
jgi:SNF2 family DNA or RNA helicase